MLQLLQPLLKGLIPTAFVMVMTSLGTVKACQPLHRSHQSLDLHGHLEALHEPLLCTPSTRRPQGRGRVSGWHVSQREPISPGSRDRGSPVLEPEVLRFQPLVTTFPCLQFHIKPFSFGGGGRERERSHGFDAVCLSVWGNEKAIAEVSTRFKSRAREHSLINSIQAWKVQLLAVNGRPHCQL